MANDAALIFRIKGDTSHVKKELSGLGMTASRTVGSLAQGVTGALNKDFSALSGGVSSLAGGLTALGPVGMAAGGALAAIGTAAMTAAGSIFALTKEAAAYGSKISDLMDKTGLGAEALTSLDYAAKLSGTSIDEVAQSVTRFSKTVGEAASGSEEAAKKLRFLGVDPQEAMVDLEGALGKVFARIQSLPPGVARTKAAIDAFGRSGANLLPLINTMNGDFDGLIQKAKEMGITFDDATAQDLDKFDDMLAQLTTQMGALTRQIGIAFLPVLSEMATEVSDFLKNNQDDINQLASDTSNFFRLLKDGLKDIVNFLRENEWAWNLIKSISPILTLGSAALSAGRQYGQTAPPTPTPPPDSGGVPSPDDILKQMQDEQAALKVRLQALAQYYKIEMDQARAHYEAVLQVRLEKLQTGEDSEDTFRSAYTEATTRFYNFLRSKVREAAQLQLQDESTTAEGRRNILARLSVDIAKLNEEEKNARQRMYERIDAINKAIVQSDIDRVNKQYNLALMSKRATLEEVKARVDLMRAQGLMTEGTGLRLVFTQELQLLDLLIQQTKDLMNVNGLSRDQYKQYAAELDVLESQRVVLLDRIKTTGVEGAKQIGAANRQAASEQLELENQIAAIREERFARAEQMRIAELEKQLENPRLAKQAAEEIAVIEVQAEVRRQQAETARLAKEREMALASVQGKANELQLKEQLEQLYREKQLLAEEEFQRRLKAIKDKAQGQGEIGKTIASEITTLKDALKKALGDIAGGLGQAVSAWVLYGETGGAVMRKVVAESLAALAQLAVVKVLTNLAEGFEALAMMNPGKAAMHFTAAKIWGAVGVGAAIGGRIVAGNSFRKEAGRETVSGAGRSSAPSGEQGKAYSSMQEQKVDMSRSASFGAVQRETVLVVKDKSGMFSKMFQVELEKNSKVRTSLRTA